MADNLNRDHIKWLKLYDVLKFSVLFFCERSCWIFAWTFDNKRPRKVERSHLLYQGTNCEEGKKMLNLLLIFLRIFFPEIFMTSTSLQSWQLHYFSSFLYLSITLFPFLFIFLFLFFLNFFSVVPVCVSDYPSVWMYLCLSYVCMSVILGVCITIYIMLF